MLSIRDCDHTRRVIPRSPRPGPGKLSAIDLLKQLRLHRDQMLARGVAPRDRFANRSLVKVEHRHLEIKAQGSLLREAVERVLAHAIAAPGIARRQMHLRPALRHLALQADLGEVVLAYRANDLGASDQRRTTPV